MRIGPKLGFKLATSGVCARGKLGCRGISGRAKGDFHARFLGGYERVTARAYPPRLL